MVVTAGASAPEELVEEVIARLAPRLGVVEAAGHHRGRVLPPAPRAARTLRALAAALGVLAAAPPGGGDPVGDDRAVTAADVLEVLAS